MQNLQTQEQKLSRALNTDLKRIEMMREHGREPEEYLHDLETLLLELYDYSLTIIDKTDELLTTIRTYDNKIPAEDENSIYTAFRGIRGVNFHIIEGVQVGSYMTREGPEEPLPDSNPACNVHSLFNIKRRDLFDQDDLFKGAMDIETILNQAEADVRVNNIKGE